jgi:uncharacterized protein YabN with tetrapyrrole methylase and pyrophosphatase domain
MKKGSLIIVGTGIQSAGQITTETLAWLREADKVLYIVSDCVAEGIIRRLNPAGAESLDALYQEGKERIDTYHAMVERIVSSVHEGNRTVAVFYGHPGVFAYPAHVALRRLRAEGYEARMLPGVSAEDNLFADLSIDPGAYGCQSYEATSFVVRRHRPDPSCALILWQIGVFGNHVFRAGGYDLSALGVLVDYLRKFYPEDHEICVYEAAVFPGCAPRMDWVPLRRLPEVKLSTASTLFVPPSEPGEMDTELLRQLGLPLPERLDLRPPAGAEGPTARQTS